MKKKRAIVLMVVRVKDEIQVQRAIKNLENNFLGDESKKHKWVLIVEPEDARENTIAKDIDIWNEVINRIRLLNNLYSEEEIRFYAFKRERTYYPKENIYIGKERKRGAIMDFSEYLFGISNNFLGTSDELYNSGIKNMCTLDLDTVITQNAISKLLEKQSEDIIIENGNVINGYGILQPHIQVIISKNTLFNAESFLFDTIKENKNNSTGTFFGKGVIHIPTFLKCMSDRLPENMILSHDIIEGEILRTLEINDVAFLESAPSSLKQLLTRENRWTRGDTQNLVMLLDKTFPKTGKWKIIKNVVRNLVPLTREWQTWVLFPLRVSNNFFATSTSLLRMLITKKNLLEWNPYNNYDITEIKKLSLESRK